MIHLKRNLTCLILSLALLSFSSAAGIEKYEALFIYNFSKYMKWPGKDKINVGVMGNSPILDELQKITNRSGSKISAFKITGSEDIVKCDIVFLPKVQSKNFNFIQDNISERDIIIVTEEEKLVDDGAEVGFFVQNGKLKFMINKDALEATNVKVSQALTSMATVK